MILGERELIKKCIGNVLENAVRFSSDHGIVEISCYSGNEVIICEIKDNGKGFKVGAVDTVFELFTTDVEYMDNRIGIGLPVARLIMDEHGGDIVIANNPEGGASVKLLFNNSLTK